MYRWTNSLWHPSSKSSSEMKLCLFVFFWETTDGSKRSSRNKCKTRCAPKVELDINNIPVNELVVMYFIWNTSSNNYLSIYFHWRIICGSPNMEMVVVNEGEGEENEPWIESRVFNLFKLYTGALFHYMAQEHVLTSSNRHIKMLGITTTMLVSQNTHYLEIHL